MKSASLRSNFGFLFLRLALNRILGPSISALQCSMRSVRPECVRLFCSAAFGFTDIVFLVLGAVVSVDATAVERVAFAFVRATQDTLKIEARCDMGVASCFV